MNQAIPGIESIALLAIDLQNDFWRANLEAHFPDYSQKVANLLNVCKTSGIEVIHVRSEFSPEGEDWLPRFKITGSTPAVRGTPGADVLPFAR